jgi:APA family basic amino acid/polyamine antiporter
VIADPLPSSRPALVRGLGVTAATSVNIANMIGTGVFLKTRVMTCNVDTPAAVLSVWAAAALLTLTGALTYAELATLLPQAGGEYVYLREAYGPRWGFLFGWTQVVIARTASQAALAVGFAIFVNILSGGALNGPYVSGQVLGHPVSFGPLQFVALAIIVLTTAINCAAVSFSGGVASLLTAVKIGLICAIGLGALLFAPGAWGHLAMSGAGGICEGVSASTRGGLAGFGAAMLGAMWAYDGWANVAPLAGEVRDPATNLPRAFVWGTLVVAVLYVFANLAYFFVLTPIEIANVSPASSVATEVASRFVGPTSITLMAAALMMSSFGSLHTSVLATARIAYAMARDRLFFPRLGRISSRTHVPVAALVAQGMWACVLALSGSFDTLTDYAVFAFAIFYGLSAASVFVLRRTRPMAPRPYRTWGYPVVPAVFLLGIVWLVVNTAVTAPLQSAIGIGLMLLGLPVYGYFARRAA